MYARMMYVCLQMFLKWIFENIITYNVYTHMFICLYLCVVFSNYFQNNLYETCMRHFRVLSLTKFLSPFFCLVPIYSILEEILWLWSSTFYTQWDILKLQSVPFCSGPVSYFANCSTLGYLWVYGSVQIFWYFRIFSYLEY